MFKRINDLLALVILGMIALFLGVLAWLEPSLRTEILVLLGPWGTLVIQFYFRKAPPPAGGSTP
jgi:hypothetical protein